MLFFPTIAVLVALAFCGAVVGCWKQKWCGLIPLVVGVFLASLLVGLAIAHVPLQLMDGYLYEMAIKHFKHALLLTDWAGGGIATYPPYFFYLAGKLAWLFGSLDIRQFYHLVYIATLLALPPVSYFFLKEGMGKPAAATASSILPLVFLCADYPFFIQKPHEMLAASLLIPAFLVLVSPDFKQLPLNKRMLTGAALALAAGMYTSFAIAPMLTVLVLLAYEAVQARFSPQHFPDPLFRNLLDIPFLASAGVVIAPWFLTYMVGLLSHGQGPHVPYYTSGDLNLWFFDIRHNGLVHYLAFAAALYGLVGMRDRILTRIGISYMVVLAGMVVAVLRASLGQYQTSAVLNQVLLVMFGTISLFIIADRQKNPTLLRLLQTSLLVLMVVCPLSLIGKIGDGVVPADSAFLQAMAVKDSVQAQQRATQEAIRASKNYPSGESAENALALQAIVQAIDAEPAVKDGSFYLANAQFMFANMFTQHKEIFPRLFYNHTYVSAYEPRLHYMQRLSSAIAQQSYTLFCASLAEMNVDLLLLRVEDDGQYYKLFVGFNHPDRLVADTNQEESVFMLPKVWIDRLKADVKNTKVLYQNASSIALWLNHAN